MISIHNNSWSEVKQSYIANVWKMKISHGVGVRKNTLLFLQAGIKWTLQTLFESWQLNQRYFNCIKIMPAIVVLSWNMETFSVRGAICLLEYICPLKIDFIPFYLYNFSTNFVDILNVSCIFEKLDDVILNTVLFFLI